MEAKAKVKKEWEKNELLSDFLQDTTKEFSSNFVLKKNSNDKKEDEENNMQNHAHQDAHLVRANAGMCGRGAQSLVQFLPLVECLRFLDADCGECGQHLEVWVSMES